MFIVIRILLEVSQASMPQEIIVVLAFTWVMVLITELPFQIKNTKQPSTSRVINVLVIVRIVA